MSIHSDVGFNTGTYTCQRAAAGSWVKGRFVRVTPTTFTFDAGIQPESGRDDEDQPEGQTTHETITIYTDTQLFASRPNGAGGVGVEADVVIVAAGPFAGSWVVTTVKYYGVISGHYVATAERLFVGEAA